MKKYWLLIIAFIIVFSVIAVLTFVPMPSPAPGTVDNCTVQKIVEVPKDFRPFQSRAELEDWLSKREHRIYTWGSIRFADIDCEDYVMSTVYQANSAGYLVLTDIVERGEKAHIELLVPVPSENTFYYVDGDEIVETRRMD